jgi:hypothetical protein
MYNKIYNALDHLLVISHQEIAEVDILCDLTNTSYTYFILSFIYHVFNTCVWSIRPKHVACVEGNNTICFSFDGYMWLYVY